MVTRVRAILALAFISVSAFAMLNCSSIKSTNTKSDRERVRPIHHPKYLAFYELSTQNFNQAILDLTAPQVHFPPLKMGIGHQANENYQLKENEDALIHFSSDYSDQFNFYGFPLKQVSPKKEQIFILKMPIEMTHGLFFKYYFKDPIQYESSKNPLWRVQLNTSIEYFDAFDTEQPIKMLWSGSIYLAVHREIDFEEAVKMGYKRLSQFYLQDVSDKGSFHILDL